MCDGFDVAGWEKHVSMISYISADPNRTPPGFLVQTVSLKSMHQGKDSQNTIATAKHDKTSGIASSLGRDDHVIAVVLQIR